MKEIIIAYDENTEANPVMGDWAGELVRCKNCNNHDRCEIADRFGENPDWFCADGEVRDNEDHTEMDQE